MDELMPGETISPMKLAQQGRREFHRGLSIDIDTIKIRYLGMKINDESSMLFWCYKNNIIVYSPAITDGSIGGSSFILK